MKKSNQSMDSAIKTQAIFGLTMSLILLGAHSATITVTNNCPNTIWPATQTGGTNVPQLSNTGFALASKASVSINAPAPWKAGRIWARTQCSTTSGRFTCATADCGTGQIACNGATGVPPASLAEFTILGSGGQDTYDISLVDGFNLPLSIVPKGGSGPKCITTSCAANVLAACPQQLPVKGSGGSVIACKSACVAFNQPQYCCTGAYAPRGSCPPTNYSQIFKNQCPQAYSYAQDDTSSTFACTGSPNYVVTFCP